MDDATIRVRNPLATRSGLAAMIALLLADGSMCPSCGYATRTTSRRWARCKRCGERVARQEIITKEQP